MRRRVSRVALVAVAVALVLLAVPFGAGIKVSFFADERAELERAALAAAVQVGPDFATGDAVELPPPLTDGKVAVYDLGLRLRDGAGPATADPTTRSALAGVVARGDSAGELVVAVPVATSEKVVGVVRASSTVSGVWRRILLAWLGVVGLAIVALGMGVAVAVRQARALSRPLEALAASARSVAEGDLSARATGSGVPEIDDAARAQNVMVERLTAVLDHQRHFVADATHQLRTPLAGLRLGLETATHDLTADPRAALAEALHQSDRLQQTVADVLALSALAAPAADAAGAVGEVMSELEHRWHSLLAAQGRRIEFEVPDELKPVLIPANACRQILDVLLDNTRVHGSGQVRVGVRDAFGAVAVDVADEGSVRVQATDLFRRGVTRGHGLGIGLGLARDLAESAGGRLTLISSAPTTFGVLLPQRARAM